MAQIGHGYGSEFQLLRFMGHHRDLLEKLISEKIGEGTFHWLDFGFEKDPMSSISGDKELKGLSFLKTTNPEKFEEINNKYKKALPISSAETWQNWDAVFTHNGTIYLVEAKAHTSELRSGKNNGGKTKETKEAIKAFMKNQLPEDYKVGDAWLQYYYQLANRLATVAFLNNNGIKARILYIYFTNGYRKKLVIRPRRKEKIIEVDNLNASEEQFRKAICKEQKTLGIDQIDTSEYLASPIFIDAEYDYDRLLP